MNRVTGSLASKVVIGTVWCIISVGFMIGMQLREFRRTLDRVRTVGLTQ